ncbi:unnamed protein product [Polarella glacialis]|uniref:PROP1-like PPR domain-containing protein n=1 Tax=Polarella glacialis TaxID=89957 RepID=A0A813I0J1_POLGL|nr:unnamed protein product [Polarella glacialis]CAE8643469.1 unnamed protein product [Polarella glacialis]
MEFVADAIQGSLGEILLFALAIVLHFAAFGKHSTRLRLWYTGANEAQKHQKLSVRTRVWEGRDGGKAVGDRDPSPRTPTDTYFLAPALLELLKESGDDSAAKDDPVFGKISAKQTDSEIKEILAAAGMASEMLVLELALRAGRRDVLRRLLSGADPLTEVGNGKTRETIFLKRLARKGPVSDVLLCLQALSPKSANYVAALDTFVERKDAASGQMVFDTANELKIVDLSLYHSFIKLQALQKSSAGTILKDLTASGLQPNHTTMHLLVDLACKGSGGLDSVWKLMEELKSIGLQPNQITCCILLKAVQKATSAAQIERIIQILNSPECGDLDEVLIASLIDACVSAGLCDVLVRFLRKRTSGGKALQVKCPHTIGSLIRAYGAVGDLDAVWAAWREMKRVHAMPSKVTLGCMVEALASNGDPEAAYEIIRQALANPQTRELVNAVGYGSVLKGFCHNQQFDRVWDVQEEMVKQQVTFSVSTFNVLIDACARSGQMTRAAAPLLKQMCDQGLQPNLITYGSLIKGYCAENQQEKAWQLLQDMKQSSGLRPDEVTYNTLLDGFAKVGQFDRGMAVLADMRASGVVPSNYTLSLLVKLANRSKRPAKAFELVEELTREFGLRPNIHVYNNLIHACTQNGDLQRALDVFGTMLGERVRPDGRSYSVLLRSCIGKRATCEAAALLRLGAGLGGASDSTGEKTSSPSPPWRRKTSEPELHPALAAALKESSRSAAATPKEGIKALLKDVVSEVLEFLLSEGLRVQKQRDCDSLQQEALFLAKEIRAAVPGLHLSHDAMRLASMALATL